MRIGLITYHWVYNFGANLQALATTRFLAQQGHEVFLLNYRPVELVAKYQRAVSKEQASAHESFCKCYLPEIALCSNARQVTEVARGLDLDFALTGSDAVFRIKPKLNREDALFPNPFWLSWNDELGLPSGSVAASAMGTNFLTLRRSTRKGVAQALRRMSTVTVRDAWTQAMVYAVTRGAVRASFCADPVFLLNQVVSIPPEERASVGQEGRPYVLVGVYRKTASANWLRSFVSAMHDMGLLVYALPTPEGAVGEGIVDKVIDFPLSPLAWYSWIANAAGYVGVRFHPIVVAMANSVPFVALDMYQRNPLLPVSSKTLDLCLRAGLSRRCLGAIRRRRVGGAEAARLLMRDRERAIEKSRTFAERAVEGYSAFGSKIGDVV